MKQQVANLSPHQNGKVFGVLFAVSSLVFVIPFLLIGLFSNQEGAFTSLLMVVLFPVIYLVLGYAMVFVCCAVYNRMFKHGAVSLVRGTWCIIANQAYSACLRGQLSSNVRPHERDVAHLPP